MREATVCHQGQGMACILSSLLLLSKTLCFSNQDHADPLSALQHFDKTICQYILLPVPKTYFYNFLWLPQLKQDSP